MLAKLIEGNITYLPTVYMYEDISYSNYHLLEEETHIEHGWKPLIEAEMPETEGFYFTPTYTEEGDEIVQGWDAHEVVEPVPVFDYYSFIDGVVEILEQ